MSAPALGGWLIQALIASALLMAFVLVVRVPVRRAFGSQLGYALWAMPALRLALPPLPEMWRERVAMPISRAGEAVAVLIVPAAAPARIAAVSRTGVPWDAMLAGGWALGAAGFLAFHLWTHRRFCVRLLSEARLIDRVEGIRVIETPAARGPLAFGIVRRFVAFPRDFADRYDREEREFALAHELGHHARGDLIANWAALAVLALHWFNPLAWRAFHAFRCDQELANDARVLAGRSRADRHIYACAIVKAAHGGAVSAACHLHTIADLKGRLRMLTNDRISRARLAGGAATVIGIVAGGLAVTASGTQAAAAVSERIEAATGTTLPMPTPPTPPVPQTSPAHPVARQIVIVRNGRTQMFDGAAASRHGVASHAPVSPVPPTPPRPAVDPMAGGMTSVVGRDGKMYRVIVAGPSDRVVMVAPPEMTSRSCSDGPDGGPKQLVLQRNDGERKVMIVCTNRIQKAAADGAALAANSGPLRADALRHAAEGLRAARAGISADQDMTDAQRAQALAGIRQAEAELAARQRD